MFSVEVTWKLNAYDKAPDEIRAQLSGAEGPLRDALRNAGMIYIDAMQKRFTRLSKGGGEWPPLALETIRKRASKRKVFGVKIYSNLILVDTQTIFTTLTPIWNNAAPGQIARDIENGVEVGIGGPSRHPESKMSIGQLAYIQHQGTQRIPSRRIIVTPDEATATAMQNALSLGLQQTLRSLQD
jgi:hypothetical protein